tara:strand:+ start:217 stop:480 length:264 start_codon:yes stop_codon:yes gene_type:complete
MLIYVLHFNFVEHIMRRDKQLKFVTLAEQRTRSAIKNMQLIGNLANRRNYEYTEAQATKIISVLEEELRELKAKFKSASKSSKKFTL